MYEHLPDETSLAALWRHAALSPLTGTLALDVLKVNSGPGEPGSLWERMYGYFTFRRPEFLARYHQRSNVESTFSMCKAKFGDSVRSKIETAMKNEALAKFVCHNLCCLIASWYELGIEPIFGAQDMEPEGEREILRMPQARLLK